MRKMSIIVEGMTCDHCVQTLSEALDDVAGVSEHQVSLAEGTAWVELDETVSHRHVVVDSIRAAGFQVSGFSVVD